MRGQNRRFEEANLEDDHEFISKEYMSMCMRPSEGTKSKAMRAYAQSGQHYTILEVRLTYYSIKDLLKRKGKKERNDRVPQFPHDYPTKGAIYDYWYL